MIEKLYNLLNDKKNEFDAFALVPAPKSNKMQSPF